MSILEAISSLIIGLRLPLSSLSGVGFIFSSLLLFLPKCLLTKISLDNFIDNHKEILGLMWILCISILFFYIVMFIFDILGEIIANKQRIKILENLSFPQREIVKSAYRNGCKIRLPFHDAHTSYLVNAMIIQSPSSSIVTSDDNFSVDYYLQPWVVKYINKHQKF